MPKQNKSEGKVPVTVMLPKSMKKQLDEFATSTRRTRGACVEIAIELLLKENAG